MIKKTLLCLFVLLGVCAACVMTNPNLTEGIFTASAATQAELKAKQAELEKKQSQLKSELSKLNASQADAQTKASTLNSLISNLNDQIATQNAKIAAEEAEINSLQNEIDTKDAEIEETYELFKSRVRSMYISGDITGGLEVLLSTADFNDMLSTMTYIEIMSEHDGAIVSALTEDKEGFQAQKALVEEKKVELEREKKELSAKKEDLDAQKRKADSLLSQISADKASLQQQQIEIDKKMASARAELDAIVAAEAKKSKEKNTTYVGGTWKWPAPGYSRISSKFGWRSWSNSYHKGIDIAAPMGASIVASNAGTVVKSAYNAGGYGNYVMVDHGGGYMTVYAHFSKRCVSVGQKVSRGQTVGKCGSTGHSTGPHLHFEIRVNGVAKNPLNYL